MSEKVYSKDEVITLIKSWYRAGQYDLSRGIIKNNIYFEEEFKDGIHTGVDLKGNVTTE